MPLPKKLPESALTKSEKPQKEKEVLANRYRVEKTLGSGNCGTALLTTDIKSKDEKEKLKVTKKIFVGNLQPDETVDAAQEANLLRSLDHPNIVKFYDSFVDGEFFCIVTEFCEGGDLDSRIQEYKKHKRFFPEALVIEWIIELLMALTYMHSRKILHRDLKTRNIFIRNDRLKIGDFGISRILMSSVDMAQTFVGTPFYMSPEVLKHEGYNSKSDVWSIGCILYDLVALEHPFQGKTLMGVMYKITESPPPAWPKNYSSDLEDVFLRMVEKDPVNRLTANEALRLPFISKQIEALLKTTMIEKHRSKDQKDVVNLETLNLVTAYGSSAKYGELKKESDLKRFKNLPPRDRLRLEKQRKADEEAQKLKALTAQNIRESKANYEANRRAMNPYESTIAIGEDPAAVRERKSFGYVAPSMKPYANRSSFSDEFDIKEESSSEEEQEETVIQKPKPRGLDGYRRASADNRPITPMKDQMVYSVRHSSLDFEDGIPENADLAETYYSQFDEFDSDDSQEELNSMATNLQAVLESNEETLTDQTLVSDDKQAGAFGPGARDIKVRKLRTEAEKSLGKEKFAKVYDYLKKARFSERPSGKKIDERKIRDDLAKMMARPDDCFLVEQLLFLEDNGVR